MDEEEEEEGEDVAAAEAITFALGSAPEKCVPAAMNLTHDNGDYLPEPGLHSSGVV